MDLINYLRSAFSAIASADVFLVFLAFLAVLGYVSILCLKWKFSLDAVGRPQKLRGLFPIMLGNLSINNITPGRGMGGEPYRLYAGRKRLNVPVSHGLASIIIERIFDAISLAILLVVALGLAACRYAVPSPTYHIAGVGIAVMISFSFLLYFFICQKPRLLRSLVVKLAGRFGVGKRAKTFFDSFTASAARAFKNFRASTKILGCALCRWLCDLVKYMALIAAVGAWLNPEYVFIAFAISIAIGTIPFLPGGLGTFDISMGGLLVLFGLPSTTALAIVLINRGISYVPLTIAGFSAISYMHLPFRRK